MAGSTSKGAAPNLQRLENFEVLERGIREGMTTIVAMGLRAPELSACHKTVSLIKPERLVRIHNVELQGDRLKVGVFQRNRLI